MPRTGRGLGAPAASGPTVRASGTPQPASDAAEGREGLRIGTYRDLWAAEAAVRSPALRFLVPSQTLELAPSDARALRRRPRRRGRGALERNERAGAGADPRAHARRRRFPDRRPRREQRQRPRGRTSGRGDQGGGGGRMTVIPIADPNFAEATLDPDRQVDRDLRRGDGDRAAAHGRRAEDPRALPGPLRAEPGRTGRPAATPRRRGQADLEGAFPAAERGWASLGARARCSSSSRA